MPAADDPSAVPHDPDPSHTVAQPRQPHEPDVNPHSPPGEEPSHTVVGSSACPPAPIDTFAGSSGQYCSDPSGTLASLRDSSGPPPDPVAEPGAEPSGTVAGSVEQQARLAGAVGGGATGAPAVPGFEILEELGRGGMGVVYRATQTGLGRTVALKMLLAGPYGDAGLRARFLLEAESVAALEHPHIIRVFAFGEAGGHPYLAMEYLPGGSLSERVRERGALTPHEAAELVARLAEAVAHAHSRGIVHRDIKPANVLLSAEGELRLADFGLAKVGRSDLSVTGQVLGTPAYMAPEQAAGKIHEVGTAADVYALGAVLYDLLTGRPPFQGDSALVTLQKVLNLEPTTPRTLRADIPRDLETICLKCLAKSPNKRYATADMLAADLRAFLGGHPITARPVSAAERAWKWVKRNPGRAGLLAAAILLLVGGLGAAEVVSKQRDRDRQDAEQRLTEEKLAAEKRRADDRIAADAQRQASLRAADEVAKQKQRETRAADLVDALAGADTAVVPRLVADLAEYTDLAVPKLRALAAQPVTEKPGLHARLALVGTEPNLATDLAAYVPDCRADELLTLRRFLEPHATAAAAELWPVLLNDRARAGPRVRAACALAGLAPDDGQWCTAAPVVAGLLVRENLLEAAVWMRALAPVRLKLLAPLIQRYRDAQGLLAGKKLDLSALVAEASAFDMTVTLLAQYTRDRPAELAELAVTTEPRHYAQFRDALRTNRAVVPLLKAELARTALPAWAGTGAVLAPLAVVGGAAPVADVFNADAVIDARAQRQGYAAATLIALGEGHAAWPLFALHKGADPSARSYLIERLAAISADPVTLVRRFGAETDTSARRALLIALGDFRAELVPAPERERFIVSLLALYRNDPDPGLHGAIDWLLRQKWGRERAIAAIDNELATAHRAQVLARGAAGALVPTYQPIVGPMLPAPPVARGRDWYVNGEGQTLAVVRGPVEFLMGSPTTEPEREVINELPHRKRINRTFAIGTKEVTVEEYLRFMPNHEWDKRCSPDNDSPVVGVSWYDCCAYCNWLSEREGIPRDQWCYLPNNDGVYGFFMVVAPGYLKRTGYRLPTEFEWECACRAGTETARYYGRSTALLPRYAWVESNAGNRTWPVGRLRPNDLGLFDPLGNALEWTEEPGGRYVTSQREESEDPNNLITDRLLMVLRGGAFFAGPMFERSAARTVTQPSNRVGSNGFRVARTLPVRPAD
jgi:formylglycine-generating enzyme required for sulfatase activity